MRNKKGQVGIIVAVLLILIVLVAIVIIWNLVNVIVSKGDSGASSELLAVKLDIKEVILFVDGVVHVNVERGIGGKMDGLKFAFYGEDGKVELVDEIGIIEELEIENYYFRSLKIGDISKVSVFPSLDGNMGNEFKFEVKGDLKFPRGLVSWWKFENEEDSVGGNMGFLVGGSLNEGVLSPNGGYFLVPYQDSLDFLEEMGLGVWINFRENNNGKIIDKGDNYELSIVNNKVVFKIISEEDIIKIESIDEVREGWHYIFVSLKKGGLSNLYVDGIRMGNFELNNFLEINNQDLKIGEGFNGEIDNVMIFDKALSIEQINGFFSFGRN